MSNNGITSQTCDIDDELDIMEDEPTEELEAVTDPDAEETADVGEPSDEDFLDDLDVVLSDEWP